MVTVFQQDLIVSLFAAMMACMILGVTIEKVAYRPLRRSTRLAPLISAIGVSIFIQTLMTKIQGPQPVGFPPVIADAIYKVGPIEITKVQIIILIVASTLMLALNFIVKYVKIGKAMRAASEDYDTAALMV
ncbi:hypothetical protein N752_14395 [Desulforamulus aquiferis]|nr:hypothetical protein N752_14395 [Desulforamulus aquiferis]